MQFLAGVGAAGQVGVAGYFAGGTTGIIQSGIEKVTFPADTISTLSATLTTGRRYPGGFADSGVAGYVGGGTDGTEQSGIDKITFPADTKTTLSATLTSARQGLAGFSNSGVAGYFGGGTSGGTHQSNIDKIAFPADTKTTLAATLTTITSFFGTSGMANYGVAGYFGGGTNGSDFSRIDKIAFPADTKTTLSATLTNAAYTVAGMADSGVAGYFGGGFMTASSIELNVIDKITFAADTKTTLSATLSSARAWVTGMADSGVAGYFGGGGEAAGATYLSGVDKIAFPADTKSTLSATLSQNKYGMAGFANCGVF